jgi:hypothetical protein
MPRRPSISGPRVKAAAVVRFADAEIVATAQNEVLKICKIMTYI